MARPEMEAAIKTLGLTVTSTFVPWAKSRSYKPNGTAKDMNLNWRVSVCKVGPPHVATSPAEECAALDCRTAGRHDRLTAILTTDYMAGMAHCPSYSHSARWTQDYVDLITWECANGKRAWLAPSLGGVMAHPSKGAAILPDAADVVWSLTSDSDVLNYGTFEEWAQDFGYDTDSRTAEATYRACLEIALKLRNAVGEDGLKTLMEASQDY